MEARKLDLAKQPEPESKFLLFFKGPVSQRVIKLMENNDEFVKKFAELSVHPNLHPGEDDIKLIKIHNVIVTSVFDENGHDIITNSVNRVLIEDIKGVIEENDDARFVFAQYEKTFKEMEDVYNEYPGLGNNLDLIESVENSLRVIECFQNIQKEGDASKGLTAADVSRLLKTEQEKFQVCKNQIKETYGAERVDPLIADIKGKIIPHREITMKLVNIYMSKKPQFEVHQMLLHSFAENCVGLE